MTIVVDDPPLWRDLTRRQTPSCLPRFSALVSGDPSVAVTRMGIVGESVSTFPPTTYHRSQVPLTPHTSRPNPGHHQTGHSRTDPDETGLKRREYQEKSQPGFFLTYSKSSIFFSLSSVRTYHRYPVVHGDGECRTHFLPYLHERWRFVVWDGNPTFSYLQITLVVNTFLHVSLFRSPPITPSSGKRGLESLVPPGVPGHPRSLLTEPQEPPLENTGLTSLVRKLRRIQKVWGRTS